MSGWGRALAKIGTLAVRSLGGLPRRLLHAAREPRPLRIESFDGYGTQREAMIHGRVVVDERMEHRSGAVRRRLVRALARLHRRGVPGMCVRASLRDTHAEGITRDGGYFRLRLRPTSPLVPEPDGSVAHLSLAPGAQPQAAGAVRETGRVFVPSPGASFAVVSDLDGTLVPGGRTAPLKAIRDLLFRRPRARDPWPGTAAWCRGLERGKGGAERNPFFYLSSESWNLHRYFLQVLSKHGLPRGPLLLRRYRIKALLSASDAQYKLERMRELLALYPRLAFVLVGDTAREDPGVFQQIVREHPGRIRAVYLRAAADGKRQQSRLTITSALRARGAEALVFHSTAEAMGHAAHVGLMGPVPPPARGRAS